MDNTSPATLTVGVLDFETFSGRFVPIVDRARKSSTARAAMADLRTFVANLRSREAREEAASHLERIDASVQSNRWHRSAAGQILEVSCVEELVRLPDHTATICACADMLYAWNPDHAELIYGFLVFLSDRTIPWASPADTWRAILPPDAIEGIANAMNALTPRDLRKLLEEADGGSIFSPEEAEQIAAWWGEYRRIVRLAQRQERGLYFSVRQAV